MMPDPCPKDDFKSAPARFAPIPTKPVVFMRTFLPYQLWRFARLNLKMIRMIGKSHRGDMPSRRVDG